MARYSAINHLLNQNKMISLTELLEPTTKSESTCPPRFDHPKKNAPWGRGDLSGKFWRGIVAS